MTITKYSKRNIVKIEKDHLNKYSKTFTYSTEHPGKHVWGENSSAKPRRRASSEEAHRQRPHLRWLSRDQAILVWQPPVPTNTEWPSQWPGQSVTTPLLQGQPILRATQEHIYTQAQQVTHVTSFTGGAGKVGYNRSHLVNLQFRMCKLWQTSKSFIMGQSQFSGLKEDAVSVEYKTSIAQAL